MPPSPDSKRHDIISALMYSAAGAHAEPGRPDLQTPYNDLTSFVVRQQARLPDYLRPAMSIATLGFDLAGIPREFARFHSQSPAARQRQLQAWRNSPLGFARDLARYYDSLALLGLYERLPAASRPTAARLEAPPARSASDWRCQIAVIGSGPGGAVTACLLAEAGRDVVLIEEGPHLRLGSCAPFSAAELEQKYRHGGQTAAMGRTKVAYVEGCCVGGGSEINSGLYHRTPPAILDLWTREFRVAGLDEAAMRPHFEAGERDLSVGPLPGPAPAASLKLHEGALRLGWKSLEVPRWFRYDTTADGGTRQSMTETYIPRFLAAGGRLLARARADRLLREGKGWSVEATHTEGTPVTVHAETVFVCAGAVQTPLLLRRSGFRHRIGDSLQLHPTVKVAARFPGIVNSAAMGVPVHQVKEFAPTCSFGCSISSPAWLMLALIDHPAAAAEARRDWTRMANYYAMITADARGSVRSVPGFRDALVRYPLGHADLTRLAGGLKQLCELLFAAGAETLFPGFAGAPRLDSADDLRRLPATLPAGRASLMTIHLFSSCPMGEDHSRCATDSYGGVHGTEGLFVNDASLLCTAPGVNPQGTIMALARRNVLRFLNRA